MKYPNSLFPLATLTLLPLFSHGQGVDAEQHAADAPRADTALKAVTVTATRREASLQTVPVAVSVVDGEQLERDNRNNIASIVQRVPTLNYRTAASSKDTSLFVRGVGTISTSPGVEPSVATVIDGVVYGRPGQATLDLMEVERLEVLRGPQGTLFGRNASAGVLNVTSRGIAEQTQGYVDYSHFGKGNENRLRFGLGGALTDTVKASLSTLWADYDGNVRNDYNGDPVNGYGAKGLRGKLQFDPADDLRVTLIGDYSDAESSVPNGVPYRATGSFASAFAPGRASSANRHVQNDYRTHAEDTHKGLSAQLDWSLGAHTLTSISAWRGWDNRQYQDQDRLAGLPQNALHDSGQVDYDQFSQELRLASPSGQLLEYVAGVYLFRGESKEGYSRQLVTNGNRESAWGRFGATNDSYALFGESTLNFTDDWRAIVGLRLTRDELEYDHRRVSTSPLTLPAMRPSFSSSGSHSDTGVSGRLGLQHDFSDKVTGYVTYSRGYKGPAYNVYFQMYDLDTEALDPETSGTYEIGLKTSALASRLTANLAVFRSDYDNYQANFYDQVGGSPVTRLINAGSVRTEGAELDLALQATRQLKISAALAYTRARIEDFQCPPAAAASCSINGQPLPFSPDWKSYLRADYSIPLENGLDLELGTDYNWQSEVQYSLDQNRDTRQGAYGIWNASVALADYNAGWRVALLARNLTDRSYAPLLSSSTGGITRMVPRDDERYFGVQLRKDF
ncbi:TonB-dependent receptor [Phytopseudomonas dryadis]|uniref:TonB-dependent receptor n=1 Tax=Phytopseudomonas dryadis TaxID=2487520 RepID=A0ABY1ZCM1_9GAMM|nr:MULTISPECIES: TonB-dependent receptor [Pseudomonas]TBV09002.1 TonB-dependent receptor [Pseudomonas dryadis]TBV18217.1 TonB-dependent receptor [Pseudomonas sp. FRB 230]